MRYALVVVMTLAVAVRAVSAQGERRPSQAPNNREVALSLISDATTGAILVEGRLGQRPVVMLLDTGAVQTIFDAGEFGIPAYRLQSARINRRGVGLDFNVVWRRADFSLGDRTWIQQDVEIADLRDISKLFRPRIDGILGEDILREFSSVQINYKWHCVMLSR